MRPIPRSYSPRFKPIAYDALADRIGCQGLVGFQEGFVLPFYQECLYEVTSDPLFFIDPRISYFLGPEDQTAPTLPFNTQWAAWSATESIRVGKESVVTLPGDGLGAQSHLYFNTTTTKLSGAFANDGFLMIAIQKTAGTIEIKKYNSLTIPQDSIYTKEFNGFSPALVNTGLAFSNETEEGPETVCYYLHAGDPRTIYCRFLSDGFNQERILNPQTRLFIGSLLGANTEQGRVVLRGLDTQGRYIRYFTHRYRSILEQTANLFFDVPRGTYDQTAFDADLSTDGSPEPSELTLNTTVVSGSNTLVVVASEDISDEALRLSVTVPRGTYNLTT